MARSVPPPPPPQASLLNKKMWRECAGASVQIPTVGSMVYYFPQGHVEQATSPPRNLSSSVLAKPCIPCRVASLQLLADPLTDEVFAKQILHPITDYNANGAGPSTLAIFPQNDVDNDYDRVVSSAKILTPSDANNGGGFSVPKSCAEAIFPRLNFLSEPPVQNIHVTDVHGSVWEFRHIYRGTPLRHLLTSGWSTFVNAKKLVAGDSVVFMKNSAGQLFIGIRRATRFAAGVGLRSRVAVEEENAGDEEEEEEEVNEVFRRDGKGKLSAKVVAEAAELAAQNMPFEVLYYPKAGWSEFVVKTEVVNNAMSVPWRQGLRVKMAMETDNSSRIKWFQGTVSALNFNENGPWRMLQITWDEPEVVLRNAKWDVKWVSPWQVELVSTAPVLYSTFPPMKKLKAVHGFGVFTGGEGNPFSKTGFTNSAMGNLNQTLLRYPTSPAGMQGARHDVFSASYFSNYPRDICRPHLSNSFGNNAAPRMETLSAEHVGSSQSDECSPDSQSCLGSYDTELVRNHNYNSIKPESGALQLFGVRIEKPVENGLQAKDSTEDDDGQ